MCLVRPCPFRISFGDMLSVQCQYLDGRGAGFLLVSLGLARVVEVVGIVMVSIFFDL